MRKSNLPLPLPCSQGELSCGAKNQLYQYRRTGTLFPHTIIYIYIPAYNLPTNLPIG